MNTDTSNNIQSEKKTVERLQPFEKNFIYRTLIETTNTGYVIIDVNGKVVDANAEYVRLSGYDDINQILGKSVINWTADHEKVKNSKAIQQTIHDGFIKNLELDYVDRYGKFITIEVNATLIKRDEEQLIIALCQDKSERRRIQNIFREINHFQTSLYSHDKIKNKLKKVTDFIIDTFHADFAGIWLCAEGDYCNSGCPHSEVKGIHACANKESCLHLVSSTSMKGADWETILDRIPFDRNWIGNIASGNCSSFLTNDIAHEQQNFNPELTKRLGIVSFAGYQISPPENKVVGVLALFSKNTISQEENTLLDIIAKSLMGVVKACEMEEDVRLYSKAINNALDGCILTDLKGLFNYANRSALKIIGMDQHEIKSFSVSELIEDKKIVNTILDKITIGDAWFGKLVCIRKNKERFPVVLSVSPVWNDEGSITNIICIFRDITKMQNLEMQLMQSHKTDTIGSMVNGIVHDFNNYIATISGYANLYLEHYSGNEEGRKYMTEIRKQTENASRAVKSMLSFARPTDDTMDKLYLPKLLNSSVALLSSIDKSKAQITINIKSEGDFYILGNKTQIQQAIINILNNSLNAINDTKPGAIDISLDDVILSPPETNFIPVTPGRYLKLIIKDNGYGMTPDLVSRIFEPFFTTKPGGKGNGLGLYIVKNIIDNHKGSINALSEIGKGTAFTIYLPAYLETYRTERQVTQNDGASARNVRVLIAEDDESMRNFYNISMKNTGYALTITPNGAEAIKKFQESPDKFDILLTDQAMPNMSGTELCREIFKIRPDLPVIIVSAYTTVTEAELKALGIKYFIPKPFNINDIIKIIRDTFNK